MVQTYYDPNLIKVNCPTSVLYDLLKQYKKTVDEENYMRNAKPGTYKYNILMSDIELGSKPVYENYDPKRNPRYFANPTKYWGPKAKAKPVFGNNKYNISFFIRKCLRALKP